MHARTHTHIHTLTQTQTNVSSQKLFRHLEQSGSTSAQNAHKFMHSWPIGKSSTSQHENAMYKNAQKHTRKSGLPRASIVLATLAPHICVIPALMVRTPQRRIRHDAAKRRILGASEAPSKQLEHRLRIRRFCYQNCIGEFRSFMCIIYTL